MYVCAWACHTAKRHILPNACVASLAVAVPNLQRHGTLELGMPALDSVISFCTDLNNKQPRECARI